MMLIIICMSLRKVSGVFISVLQDLIPEVTPSHKCYMNMGSILKGCGVWVFEM